MDVVRAFLEHTATRLFLFALAVFGLLTRPEVRDALADAYEARWPTAVALAVVAGAAAAASALLLRRRARVIDSADDLQRELLLTVRNAEERLYCVGSRSRDRVYLEAIEDRLNERPRLQHTRLLCGEPAHAAQEAPGDAPAEALGGGQGHPRGLARHGDV